MTVIICVSYHSLSLLHTVAPVVPEVTVSVLNNGSSLNISWVEPFYYASYPVTGYRLDMLNTTSGRVSTLVDNTTALSHVISSEGVVSECHWLNFSVTAYSLLGNATKHTLGIFPKGQSLFCTYPLNCKALSQLLHKKKNPC